MKITISNRIQIEGVPETLEWEIKNHLTVENPVYADNQKMGRYNGNTDQNIFLYEQPEPGHLITPRGFINQLTAMVKKHGVSFTLTDSTREMKPVDFEFNGKLRPYQQKAALTAMRRRFGVMQAPTGSGKTVMALAIIARRQQPALIVVHTKELLNQWVDRIHAFLGIPVDKIGIIGNGKKRIGARITVAMVQTLHKVKDDVSPYIGHLIVDECHRTPSRTFTEAVSAFDSRFMLGLSATAYRRDRLTKLIYLYMGDQAAAVDRQELTDNGAILPFRVKWVKTDFNTSLDPSKQYSAMLSALTRDHKRNRLVCSESAQYAKAGKGMPLVISDRKEHCQAIAEAMGRDYGISPTVLTGNIPAKDRERVVAGLNAGSGQALIATGQLIGEGFDLPSLGAVILATPIRFQGRLIQTIGRALRPSPGQDYATVVDFVDASIGVLEHSAKQRLKVYRDLGAGGC